MATIEKKLSRIVTVKITVDQEEREREAINRILQAYAEAEIARANPNCLQAMRRGLDDLYTLGVIQRPGAPEELTQ